MPRPLATWALAGLAGLATAASVDFTADAQEKPAARNPSDEEETGQIVEVDPATADALRRRAAPDELQWIESALSDPARLERWRSGSETTAQVRERLLSRQTELRRVIADRPSTPLLRWRSASSTPKGPVQTLARQVLRTLLDDSPGTTRPPLRELLQSMTAPAVHGDQLQQGASCNFLEIGVKRASGFRLYRWVPPRKRGAMAFWPLSDDRTLPNTTPTTGWVNEVGANFWGWAESYSNFPLPGDMIAQAAVLRFTFPEPPCPATLCWGTRAHAVATHPWTLPSPSEGGWISTEWVMNQAPLGTGFLPFPQAYEWVHSGLYRSAAGANDPEDDTDLEDCFTVLPGTRSRVYLGLSLMVLTGHGRASTIDVGGIGDHFNFGDGVIYVMGAGQ